MWRRSRHRFKQTNQFLDALASLTAAPSMTAESSGRWMGTRKEFLTNFGQFYTLVLLNFYV